MRHSPARAHYQQQMAAAQPADSSDQPLDKASANAYELMLVALAEHKRQLKDIKGSEKKAELKAKLLPEYAPWIAGVLEADTGRQDDVLMTVFVWTIDTADFATAVRIGAYAIRHKLVMPDQYQRDVASVLAEEIADIALKRDDAFRQANINHIESTVAITDGRDIHDAIRAKLYKAYGYALRTAGEPNNARAMLARALELDSRVGVKKDIERLDVVIKNLPAEPVKAQAQAEGSDESTG
jgi:hypothetical protein